MCMSRVFTKVQVCVHVSTPAFFPTFPPTWKDLVHERHIFLLSATFLQPTPTSYSRLSFSGSMLNFALVPCTSAVPKKRMQETPFPFPVSTPWPSLFDSAVSDSSSAWWVVPWRMTSPFFVRGLQFQFQTFPEIFEKLVFLMLEFWLKMYIKIVVPIHNISK